MSPVRFVCGAVVPGERRPPRASAALTRFGHEFGPIATVARDPRAVGTASSPAAHPRVVIRVWGRSPSF